MCVDIELIANFLLTPWTNIASHAEKYSFFKKNPTPTKPTSYSGVPMFRRCLFYASEALVHSKPSPPDLLWSSSNSGFSILFVQTPKALDQMLQKAINGLRSLMDQVCSSFIIFSRFPEVRFQGHSKHTL